MEIDENVAGFSVVSMFLGRQINQIFLNVRVKCNYKKCNWAFKVKKKKACDQKIVDVNVIKRIFLKFSRCIQSFDKVLPKKKIECGINSTLS